jgi:hypothetical protein
MILEPLTLPVFSRSTADKLQAWLRRRKKEPRLLKQSPAKVIRIADTDEEAHIAQSLRHSASARHHQQPFPFLGLPVELRNKTYVFGLAKHYLRLRITGKAYLSGPKTSTELTFLRSVRPSCGPCLPEATGRDQTATFRAIPHHRRCSHDGPIPEPSRPRIAQPQHRRADHLLLLLGACNAGRCRLVFSTASFMSHGKASEHSVSLPSTALR